PADRLTPLSPQLSPAQSVQLPSYEPTDRPLFLFSLLLSPVHSSQLSPARSSQSLCGSVLGVPCPTSSGTSQTGVPGVPVRPPLLDQGRTLALDWKEVSLEALPSTPRPFLNPQYACCSAGARLGARGGGAAAALLYDRNTGGSHCSSIAVVPPYRR
uniref:Uncharacterized protein n=1 Tax=Neogobius melanostomus TaxID=47308 RepID=A0A8C6UEK4_9GOBI